MFVNWEQSMLCCTRIVVFASFISFGKDIFYLFTHALRKSEQVEIRWDFRFHATGSYFRQSKSYLIYSSRKNALRLRIRILVVNNSQICFDGKIVGNRFKSRRDQASFDMKTSSHKAILNCFYVLAAKLFSWRVISWKHFLNVSLLLITTLFAIVKTFS